MTRVATQPVDVVVPTVGRPSLVRLLAALGAGDGPLPARLVLVDDRPDARCALVADGDVPARLADRLRVVLGPGRGPAAARNAGWRAGAAPWVAFLDDDVEPSPGWLTDLARDLDVEAAVWGSQGALTVPLPANRPPTDWERQVAGLADARWATADMAYRREALEHVDGFDERFPRAYREDADLAIRVQRAGGRLVRGSRMSLHPVPPAPAFVSVRRQAGNRDDVRMWRLHGPRWRRAAEAPRGRAARHALTTGLLLAAAAALVGGHRRLGATAALAWAAATTEFALSRVLPGPRTAREIAVMATSSIAIPPLATATPRRRARGAARRTGWRVTPRAVLLDRDGTLVEDVPYNGDPAAVRALPGVADGLGRLRAAGLRLALVSNQSGIARGLLVGRAGRCGQPPAGGARRTPRRRPVLPARARRRLRHAASPDRGWCSTRRADSASRSPTAS